MDKQERYGNQGGPELLLEQAPQVKGHRTRKCNFRDFVPTLSDWKATPPVRVSNGRRSFVWAALVPDLALAFAGRAFDRIDSVTRLHRLRNRLDAHSIAVWADTLFDLRLHV